MNGKTVFVLFHFLMAALNCCYGNQKNHGTQAKMLDLDQVVKTEAEKIFKISGASCTITLTDGETNSSVPVRGIFLSRRKLNIYEKKYDPKMLQFVVDYLLSHELAHQKQFIKYADDILKTTSCEKKSLYECQADIIAGMLISELHNYKDTVNMINEDKFLGQQLTYLYEIGDDEYSIGTHPSHTQRRNAIRIGISYGMLGGNWNKFYTERLINSIDYVDREDDMAWSLRLAKRIVHFPMSVGKYISVVTDLKDTTSTVWDTSKSHPYLTYHRFIKNRSDKPVKIFVQFRIVGKIRNNPYEKKMVDIQGESKSFSFTLMPNESKKCEGALNWFLIGNSTFEPAIVFPPDNEALYNAEYVDQNIPVQTDSDCPETSYTSDTHRSTAGDNRLGASASTETIHAALEKVNGASLDNFDEFKTGFSEEMTSEIVSYFSNYNFPFSKSISIDEITLRKQKSRWLMHIELYRDSDEKAAKKVFQKFAAAINSYKYIKIDTPSISPDDLNDTTRKVSILPYNVYATLYNTDSKEYTMRLDGRFLDTDAEIDLLYDDDERYPYITVRIDIEPKRQ